MTDLRLDTAQLSRTASTLTAVADALAATDRVSEGAADAASPLAEPLATLVDAVAATLRWTTRTDPPTRC